MTDSLLIDTDVLVDFLRGNALAIGFLEKTSSPLRISAITAAELYAGAREKELAALDEFLLAFDVIPVDRKISRAAGGIRSKYHKSHGVGLADALIAATAETAQLCLATLNKKHFPMLKNILVPYRKK